MTGVAWWLPRDQETDRCVDAGADCFNLPELEGARDAAAGTTVAAALLGAAGLVAGAVWLASLGDEASEIACAPVGLGVACAGGF